MHIPVFKPSRYPSCFRVLLCSSSSYVSKIIWITSDFWSVRISLRMLPFIQISTAFATDWSKSVPEVSSCRMSVYYRPRQERNQCGRMHNLLYCFFTLSTAVVSDTERSVPLWQHRYLYQPADCSDRRGMRPVCSRISGSALTCHFFQRSVEPVSEMALFPSGKKDPDK